MYWPCKFRNKYGRCQLVKSGHGVKGHQNAEGKIIAVGDYGSTFYADDYLYEWIEDLRYNLDNIQIKLHDMTFQKPQMSEQEAASKLHRYQMNDIYASLGRAADFISHSTCFSCLRELPEHPLPYGHVLCTPCVETYGQRYDKTLIEMCSCPLHDHDTKWQPPWQIKTKPRHAGVRILCLNGQAPGCIL
jgi:hypothetical protein